MFITHNDIAGEGQKSWRLDRQTYAESGTANHTLSVDMILVSISVAIANHAGEISDLVAAQLFDANENANVVAVQNYTTPKERQAIYLYKTILLSLSLLTRSQFPSLDLQSKLRPMY